MSWHTGTYLDLFILKSCVAEGVGFEPTKVSLAGFQHRCTRPLCEPSVGELTARPQALQNYRHPTQIKQA